jgi:sulfatase maturation enzyme AslB (radical SAM superfamily)
MSDEVLHKIFHEVFASKHITDRINFVWHAGEPLAVPISFFRQMQH